MTEIVKDLQVMNGRIEPSPHRPKRKLDVRPSYRQGPPPKWSLLHSDRGKVSHDPSLDVRLSAVEALYLFGADPGLSHRIEVALPGQTRPEVQLALIDLLGALRQKRAAEALRRLMDQDQLPPEARQRAEQRLSQMNL